MLVPSTAQQLVSADTEDELANHSIRSTDVPDESSGHTLDEFRKQFLHCVVECPVEKIARLNELARRGDDRFWTEFEFPPVNAIDIRERIIKFVGMWLNDTFQDVESFEGSVLEGNTSE